MMKKMEIIDRNNIRMKTSSERYFYLSTHLIGAPQTNPMTLFSFLEKYFSIKRRIADDASPDN